MDAVHTDEALATGASRSDRASDGPETTPGTTRHIVLAERPEGWPTEATFRLATVQLPALGPDQVLVRNQVMSVDPYMRGRMNDGKSYVPPFAIDSPLDGGAVGEVIASTSEDLPVGTTVLHGLGWREHAILNAAATTVVDATRAPASAYLGVLGMPGLTAFAGLLAAAEFRPGDAVFVSGAAGAVGSLVGQIAKLKGASRVVGSAGSPEKVAHLLERGFDAAFDYHDGPVVDRLLEAAPGGIDVYFDNVGGEHLEAALTRLNLDGRVALCGAISQYNEATPPPDPATWPWPSASDSRCAASSSASTPTCGSSSSPRWAHGSSAARSGTTRRSATASTPPRPRSWT